MVDIERTVDVDTVLQWDILALFHIELFCRFCLLETNIQNLKTQTIFICIETCNLLTLKFNSLDEVGMSNLPDTKNVHTNNATGTLASLNRYMMNDQSIRSSALYRLLPIPVDLLLFICRQTRPTFSVRLSFVSHHIHFHLLA